MILPDEASKQVSHTTNKIRIATIIIILKVIIATEEGIITPYQSLVERSDGQASYTKALPLEVNRQHLSAFWSSDPTSLGKHHHTIPSCTLSFLLTCET
jgi:hypothetical protein